MSKLRRFGKLLRSVSTKLLLKPIMSDEEFGICPFNSSHRIILYRMPGHIVKCRKSYRGPPLEQCVYNATHYVPMGTMHGHLQQCRDCYRFNQPKYVEIAKKSIEQDG